MKRTKKFIAAEKIALEIGLVIDDQIYDSLQFNNYFWDSKQGIWFEGDEPDPPTNLLKIRVWADQKFVQSDAGRIIQALEKLGYKIGEKSDEYTCRPPKQLEARIYLTFTRS